MLNISHLDFRVNDTQILHDISFSVGRAEILVIIGPSGSGKSTLLRLINRLEEPSGGNIMLQNTDITTLPPTELRRKVGMIFQKTAILEGTVADNIRYGPNLCDETIRDNEIVELLEAVALDASFMSRPARELSGGQEQRLSIARALANRPDILLLDEPTSSLDPIATKHVESSLLRARDERKLTLVWVSHAIEQARRVADRVMLLEAGRMVRLASANEMLNEKTGDERALAFAAGDASS